jgi:signal transduction histidine kinase
MHDALESPTRSYRVRAWPLLQRITRAGGALVLAASVLILVGWATRHQGLQRLFIHGVTVKANTAIGLGLAAVALLLNASPLVGISWLRRPTVARALARTAALMVAALGAATLAQYVFGASFGIDQLFFRADADAALTATPGRMAAVTAFGFVLLGGGLATLDAEAPRGFRVAPPLLLATAALGLTALLGYTYGAIPTVGLGQGIQIALPTAVAFILVAVGALVSRPRVGWMRQMLSPHAGGLLARRLLPFAILVPLGLGALRVLGTWSGSYNAATLSSFVAVLTMLAFGVMIMRTSVALDRADVEREVAEGERMELILREESARSRAEAEHAARDAADAARHRAELLLREKADALALVDLVLESSPVAFALLDTELRYVRVNAALAALSGRSPADFVGRTPTDHLPSVAWPIEETLRTVLATNAPMVNVEYDLPGTSTAAPGRHFLMSCYPVRFDGGGLVGVGAFLLETTDRRVLEDQLRQAQKMEAVGQLAGGVAHDFNNVLTVISSYASMLLDSFASDDERRADVEEIKDAAWRAAQLTRQLLAFSRKQVIAPRILNLNDVVAGTEKMLRRLIGADVELTTTLSPDLHAVRADAGQLEQVLMNLAVNARDAMPDGGRLSIETANVTLSGEYAQRHAGVTPGEYVMLAVSDTGTGMSTDVQAHVFEPFFTTKDATRGTGLGLSTVYGIVKQFGGDVWLYSEPGHGTTFKVYLPPGVGSAQADVAEHVRSRPVTGHETVLVVDDDERVRQVAARVLRANGYVVLEATDGASALTVSLRHGGAIDLILSDVVMPGASGPSLMSQISRARPTTRVVFMSGYTNDEVVRRGIFDGQTAFLQKPFTPPQLLAKVRDVLSGD